ncbi:carboxypeptidase M32 [Candidatus Peribacteria bacterium]|nr:carboxypeptidase M32 [Candidatus Peribacteria bacterium]
MNFATYQQTLRKITDLSGAAAVLGWDTETYMPSGSHALRGQQLGTLSSMAHSLFTAESFGQGLQTLLQDPSLTPEQRQNVHITQEEYERARRIPASFVERMASLTTLAHQAWARAKTEKNFAIFAPFLTQVVAMNQEKAQLLGYEHHPYDALLHDYDRGMTTAAVEGIFATLLPALQELIAQVMAGLSVRMDFLEERAYPHDEQFQLSKMLSAAVGFDFTRGRLDEALHPFSTSFHPQDVRMTTRLDPYKLFDGIGSTIHEAGHSMHSQGLRLEHYGLPQGTYSNLSTAESQSRIWENNIGRSRAFMQWLYPLLRAVFPVQLHDVSEEECYAAMNLVRPDYIRVEADELTYHMHIALRFGIEKDLLTGALLVAEVPEYWNTQMQELLGMEVPHDALGCLQDVHWAHGSMGYFPTYSLGTLYAAQYMVAMQRELDADALIARGEFAPLLQWLREHIHTPGDLYTAGELCERVTGEPLNPGYFLRYAREKFFPKAG